MRPTYGTGRHPGLACLFWFIYALVGVGLWRHQIITEPVTGGILRAFAAPEIAAVVSAPLAVHGLTARMPTAEITSPRGLHYRAALSAASLIIAFAAIPLITLAGVDLAPHLMPPGTFSDISTEDRLLTEIYRPTMALSISAAVTLSIALALLSTALVGALAGPLLFLAVTAALTFAQATPGDDVLALGGAGEPPYQLHTGGLILATVISCTAVLSWANTRAAATPVASTVIARLKAYLSTPLRPARVRTPRTAAATSPASPSGVCGAAANGSEPASQLSTRVVKRTGEPT